MKILRYLFLACVVAATATGCDAFQRLTRARLKTAQGAPYELLVVCEQREWTGWVGDTLRAVLTAPIAYLNQTEPLFDVLRVRAQDFSGMLADHRNILKVVEDPALAEASAGVEYDVTAAPQIVLTLQGPDDEAIEGPWLISVIVTRTPKVCNVCCSRIAVSFSSLAESPPAFPLPLVSLLMGGNMYFLGMRSFGICIFVCVLGASLGITR